MILCFICIGEAIILRQVRNGVELPPIDQNLFYDFDYQITNHITPRRVLPVSNCSVKLHAVHVYYHMCTVAT